MVFLLRFVFTCGRVRTFDASPHSLFGNLPAKLLLRAFKQHLQLHSVHMLFLDDAFQVEVAIEHVRDDVVLVHGRLVDFFVEEEAVDQVKQVPLPIQSLFLGETARYRLL